MSPKRGDKTFKLTEGSLCCLASYVKGKFLKEEKSLKKAKKGKGKDYGTMRKSS